MSLLPLLRAVRTMSIVPETLLDNSKYRRGDLWKVGEHELVEKSNPCGPFVDSYEIEI